MVERDRELVGLTHYLFYRSTIQIDPSCCLQDVFTLPDVNGQGVGRAVIEAVYNQTGLAIDRRAITLAEPIKTVGIHSVPAHLQNDVQIFLQVEVVAH